jgi:hypothetical protein
MGRMISAETHVPAPVDVVFAFLADLDDHWLRAGRFIEVVALEGAPGERRGGAVRIHGPLGIRRTAATVVEAIDPPAAIRGTASIGAVTKAKVEWQLAEQAAGTQVGLSAEVLRATPFDSAVLALGGAWWLRRRFEEILAVLVRHFQA